MTYISAIIWNASIADKELWEKLHHHFTEPELVKLGSFVALTFGQQRWIKTLGIGHGEVQVAGARYYTADNALSGNTKGEPRWSAEMATQGAGVERPVVPDAAPVLTGE